MSIAALGVDRGRGGRQLPASREPSVIKRGGHHWDRAPRRIPTSNRDRDRFGAASRVSASIATAAALARGMAASSRPRFVIVKTSSRLLKGRHRNGPARGHFSFAVGMKTNPVGWAKRLVRRSSKERKAGKACPTIRKSRSVLVGGHGAKERLWPTQSRTNRIPLQSPRRRKSRISQSACLSASASPAIFFPIVVVELQRSSHRDWPLGSPRRRGGLRDRLATAILHRGSQAQRHPRRRTGRHALRPIAAAVSSEAGAALRQRTIRRRRNRFIRSGREIFCAPAS